MLPVNLLPIVERWDCHQCGFCCRGSIVPLSVKDMERLRLQQWEEHPELRGVAPMTPIAGRRDEMQLAKRADGSCVFLLPDGLCRIHKELGFAAKPLICRMFPLQFIPHERGAVLTLRRACPSAAADQGRALQDYLPDALAYAEEGELLTHGAASPIIKPGEAADWTRARIVLEGLRRITNDERYPPIRRLVHGHEFCRLLEAAQLAPLDNGRLAELVQVLERNIAEEAAPYFTARQSPTPAARVLFRQTALEVVRLHPRTQQTATWATRFKLPLWAWQMVRGKGELPRVHEGFPQTTFAQLEEPLGRLEPLLYQALARYFETSTASYQFALADKPGWSIVESYRQLALLYPLGLWLLRWATAGRAPEPTDVYEIICTLDRAQGYAPLNGAKQRNRLRTLERLEQLPALVAWYGR
jgi:lysine-N-methylase